MPFTRGDRNINRAGRSKNAETDMLRAALYKEGVRRKKDFWQVVANKAFVDNNIMIAVLKKFVPDTRLTQSDGKGLGESAKIIIVRDKSQLQNAKNNNS